MGEVVVAASHDSSSEQLQKLLGGCLAQHQNDCAKDGLIASVWIAIEKLRDSIACRDKDQAEKDKQMAVQLAEERGIASGELAALSKRSMTIQAIVGVVTIATLILSLFLKTKM